jgi:Ca-activated chloride channel family protein
MMKRTWFGLASIALVLGLIVACNTQYKGDIWDRVHLGAPTASRVPEQSLKSRGLDAGLGSHDEELWIIERAPVTHKQDPRDDQPGGGALVVVGEEGQSPVPIPLEHTNVRARITGFVASVDVQQRFVNRLREKIEVAYVFPLPQNAAISGFVMTIGERKIRGIIRDRAEAKAIYDSAKRHGRVASLLAQNRPNIFTQKVANIEPGKRIDVSIRYFHTLRYEDGEYEFVYPMVVGPRFNPPGTPDGIGASPARSPNTSGQKVDVSYLRPNRRSGTDIDLRVEVDAGVPLQSIRSLQHEVEMLRVAPHRVDVQLARHDRVPNKDFILRFRVGGGQPQAHLMTHRDDRGGGTFALMLFPPAQIKQADRSPLEMIFVLDTSGSMHGRPIEQAKAAIETGLSRLHQSDTFQLIRFSDHTSILGPKPVPATAANIAKARRHLRALKGQGPTHMLAGVNAALDFPHDPQRLRFVAFFTDGYIGNERSVLRAVHEGIGASRIFSFGVGSSPNRFLMNRMAKVGQGAAAYLSTTTQGPKVMTSFMDRISYPAMRSIEIDWGTLGATEIYPQRIPDLFAGRPVILTGRFTNPDATTLTIRGHAGRRPVVMRMSIRPIDSGPTRSALPAVWARQKIANLTEQSWIDPNPHAPDRIRTVALEHGLISSQTSFIAVDGRGRTLKGPNKTVPVPVPIPDGVDFDHSIKKPGRPK